MNLKRMVTAAAAATALAAAVPASALALGSAAGIVTFDQGSDEKLEFAVTDRSGPDGGSIIYSNRTAGFTYTAQVSCVVVSGNTATFSYTIPSRPQVPQNIWGLPITFTVVDDVVDEIGYAVVGACQPAATNDILGGNLSIHDR